MKKRYVQVMMAGMTVMLSLAMPVTTVWAAVPETEKEQTVYVNADENGNTEKVIVSNWLKNAGKDASIQDKSDLSDIQNVKGEETFSQNADGTLTWNADGKDIYYQGESKKELPVSVKMTYFLDGKEIPASELAGKSGKVKIRIDYENHSGEETKVNGKTETICTPFMMVTGMILPTDKFTNIEVENGKVISDGKNDIVVGMGFPGLTESLKLSDIEGMEDKKLPDYVEITADVQDFSLALTATVATTGTLKELGLDDIGSMDELEEKIDLLTNSSEALVEGSKALKEGVSELNASADTFSNGLDAADGGAGQLKNGIDEMNSKKGELLNGINQFADGVKVLNNGAYQLKEGVKEYTKGADQLVTGVNQLSEGTEALETGTKQLEASVGTYTQNAAQISAGLGTLYEKLYGSMGIFSTLPDKMKELETGVGGMAAGAKQFQDGASEVQKAATNLGGQMGNLKNGMTTAVGCIDQAIRAIELAQTTDENKLAEAKNMLDQAKAGLQQVAGTLDKVEIDTDSLAKLSEGAKTAAAGAGKMQAELGNVAGKLNGMGDIQQTAGALLSGVKDLKDGSEALCGYNDALNAGIKEAAAGAKTLNSGAKQLKAGGSELVANDKALNSGAEQLAAGSGELLAGGKKLQSGAGTLSDGIGQLADGASELKGGTGKLAAGGKELKAGTGKLAEGSSELADGMKKFNNEGIQKLADLLTGETQSVLNRLRAVVDADEEYTAFDGKNETAGGNVKFIIETAGIE